MALEVLTRMQQAQLEWVDEETKADRVRQALNVASALRGVRMIEEMCMELLREEEGTERGLEKGPAESAMKRPYQPLFATSYEPTYKRKIGLKPTRSLKSGWWRAQRPEQPAECLTQSIPTILWHCGSSSMVGMQRAVIERARMLRQVLPRSMPRMLKWMKKREDQLLMESLSPRV